MARIYIPVAGFSEDFSGWADYAAFTAARTDTDPLFWNYYGPETQSDEYGLDFTKTYQGNPSLYFVYNTNFPSNDRGWYQSSIGDQPSIYARARVELAPTFVPTGGTLPYQGFDLQTIYINYYAGGYTYIRLTIFDGRVYLMGYDPVDHPPRDIGSAAAWYGPIQYVVAADVVNTEYARVQVYVGGMSDTLDELTLFADETFYFPSAPGFRFRDMEHFTGFWGELDVPSTLDFKVWVYTIEVGYGPALDAVGRLSLSESVRARTSYEVPLLEPVYETDFSEFADFTAFLSAKPWMFTNGGEDASFTTSMPYTDGENAWASKFRVTPDSDPVHSSPVFSGGLAGTTSWFSRQVFELGSGLNPSVSVGTPRDGIRASQIAMDAGGAAYDYSAITLNGGDVYHVWDADNATYDSVTSLGAWTAWKGQPVQVVHWVERITSTTVRVRIWFGLASVRLPELPQIYDEVHTSSFTDAEVYQTEMWSMSFAGGLPASDAWTLWIYETQQGTVDYFSDPSVVIEDALLTALLTDDLTPVPVVLSIANIATALSLAGALDSEYFAIATIIDRLPIVHGDAVTMRLQGQLMTAMRLLETARLALDAPLGDTITIGAVVAAARAVAVLEDLQVEPVLSVAARYGLQTGDTLRLTPAVLTFFGGAVADGVVFGDAPFETGRLRAVATDGTLLADTVAPRFFIRADVADEIELTPAQLLQWAWRPTVQDGIALSAGLLLPDGSFITWATNTRTGATANYSNYEYTSFAQRGTHYLATREDGLYRLDGDTDNGVDIIAELRSGFLQFAGGKFTSFAGIYLGVHGTGALFLKLLTGDEKSYTYRVIAQNMETTKVRVGKGLRARYFAFELVSSGQDFDLDTVEFLPLGAQRRV